ncbi:MAG: heme ABC transporter ATP-binding protein [Gemmatimonadetes bacterium]|nr:heme ABC transporter ATP-binding protein [Gemmatimonadota bacterium]|tara:strand:+ start:374 stop:1186 length:813 start_codon:yes stop_codon:yes gene_type:complete
MQTSEITYRAGKRTLLEDISISISPGEVTAIIGPNAAGKSTFLKLLAGDMKPTSGSISLNGIELADWTPQSLSLFRSVMPQASTLTFPFTAKEVVGLGRLPHQKGESSKLTNDIVLEVLEWSGTRHLADRLYTTLSGGEKQRIDFARAISQVWQPVNKCSRYLLLDEPTSSLDLSRQHETLQRICAFAQDNVATIVVLHDLNLAAHYADRILVLSDGCSAGWGSPKDVLTSDLIGSTFGLSVIVSEHPQYLGPLIIPNPNPIPERVNNYP